MNTNTNYGSHVLITGNYEYSKSFIGLTGIVVKTTPDGCNLFVSKINLGGSYEDQIFWFPFNCFETIGSLDLEKK